MYTMPETRMFSFRIPANEDAILTRHAERACRSRTDIIREAIRNLALPKPQRKRRAKMREKRSA